jgi:hypothetical protein
LAAGFAAVQIHDVSDRSVRAFARHRAEYFAVQMLCGEIDLETKQEADRFFAGVEASVGHALLVSARKSEPG